MFQVDKLVEHGVGGGDDARVGLEAALRGDHLDEFLGDVHVALLERVGRDAAEPVLARVPGDGIARGTRGAPQIAPDLVEGLGVVELGQRHTVEVEDLAVGVVTGHDAIGIHGDVLQEARAVAVLGLVDGGRRTGVLGGGERLGLPGG